MSRPNHARENLLRSIDVLTSLVLTNVTCNRIQDAESFVRLAGECALLLNTLSQSEEVTTITNNFVVAPETVHEKPLSTLKPELF